MGPPGFVTFYCLSIRLDGVTATSAGSPGASASHQTANTYRTRTRWRPSPSPGMRGRSTLCLHTRGGGGGSAGHIEKLRCTPVEISRCRSQSPGSVVDSSLCVLSLGSAGRAGGGLTVQPSTDQQQSLQTAAGDTFPACTSPASHHSSLQRWEGPEPPGETDTGNVDFLADHFRRSLHFQLF